MLKRDISATNILIAAAGGMIGSGWLFSPFISAQMAGTGALISWIIATLFMLLIALPLCELGAMIPISGGIANYPTFTHGQEVGFLFAWISWLSYVVMTPIEIQAVLQYGSYFFPSLVINSGTIKLSPLGYGVAILIMFAVVLINSIGVKILAEFIKYMTIIKVIIPVLAILSLLYSTSSWHNIQFDFSQASAWKGIFSALSLGGVIFAFTGFQNGLMLAGEVKNPQRNIPFAILGAVVVGFILYFMLQVSFLAAMPEKYLVNGWGNLHFPGDSGPLVGLTVLLGLGVISTLLLIDSSFSPMGTTLVYTAATSRILYGMALQEHLPKVLLKLNRFKIPMLTLYINLAVGALLFLPFPGWQKMVAFLSSCSILSYGIGPICLLAFRKTQPDIPRPFKLSGSLFFCHLAFYFCNLMLYWCSFEILWKLYIALIIGLVITVLYQGKKFLKFNKSIVWFFSYLTIMFFFSYLGSFGGIGLLKFPFDLLLLFPFSVAILFCSQFCLTAQPYSLTKEFQEETHASLSELPSNSD